MGTYLGADAGWRNGEMAKELTPAGRGGRNGARTRERGGAGAAPARRPFRGARRRQSVVFGLFRRPSSFILYPLSFLLLA